MQFRDSSTLKVGPSSSVKLDKFVYDPNKSGGTVAVEATRGTFRFVTGSQGAGAYKVKTPLWYPWRTRLRNSIVDPWRPLFGWALAHLHPTNKLGAFR